MLRTAFRGIFFALLLCPALLHAQAANDYNSDRVSDLAFVRINPPPVNSLRWYYRPRLSSTLRPLGAFGLKGDHLAPGRWLSVDGTSAGVVSLNPEGTIDWRIRTREGTEHVFQLGTGKDIVVSGGDFDGSGLLDSCVVSSRRSRLTWKICTDPFPASNASCRELQWGKGGDMVFFARVASGRDALGLLRSSKTGRTVLLKDLVTGEERSFSLPKSVPSPVRPVAVKQSAGDALLAFTQAEGAITKVYIVSTDGRLVRRLRMKGNGTAVIGDFLINEPGEEIGIQNQRTLQILNPVTGRIIEKTGASHILVDEININSFSPVSSQPDTCTSVNPSDGYKRGFVWKPNSDTQHFAVAVMPHRYQGRVSKVEALTASGHVIKEIGLKGCGNADTDGPRCMYQDRSLTGSDYRNRYGSIILRLRLSEGGCDIYYLKDPSRRID